MGVAPQGNAVKARERGVVLPQVEVEGPLADVGQGDVRYVELDGSLPGRLKTFLLADA